MALTVRAVCCRGSLIRSVAPVPKQHTIRLASLHDARVLFSIRRDAILGIGIVGAREWADSARPDRVLRAIEIHEVWLVDAGSSLLGWVEVNGHRIEGLYVDPARSGSGVGSTLLRHAEARARSAGFREVALDASKNAMEFYIRGGYLRRAEPLSDGSIPMSKPLDHAAPAGECGRPPGETQ